VLTGSGAETGFLTTKGVRDVLNMRRGLKERQYDLKYDPPPPLVPRHLVKVVNERINCEGEVVEPLDEKDVYDAIDDFRKMRIRAVGVSLLFSFMNPAHEHRIGEILKTELPDTYVSLSCEVLPQIRVYERHSTTALNAYVGPILSDYLKALEEKAAREGIVYSKEDQDRKVSYAELTRGLEIMRTLDTKPDLKRPDL